MIQLFKMLINTLFEFLEKLNPAILALSALASAVFAGVLVVVAYKSLSIQKANQKIQEELKNMQKTSQKIQEELTSLNKPYLDFVFFTTNDKESNGYKQLKSQLKDPEKDAIVYLQIVNPRKQKLFLQDVVLDNEGKQSLLNRPMFMVFGKDKGIKGYMPFKEGEEIRLLYPIDNKTYDKIKDLEYLFIKTIDNIYYPSKKRIKSK